MNHSLTIVALMACSLGAAGCSEDDSTAAPPHEDKKPVLAFEAASPTGASTVSLRGEVQGGHLTIDVVGRGIAPLYALGFRLTYEPKVLSFDTFDPAGAWPSDSIRLGREAAPGLLVAALTNRGEASGLMVDDVPLGSVRFIVNEGAPTDISFVPARSFAAHADGSEPDIGWFGGSLTYR